ncbi:hypothetical protein AJ80_06817 [Polytolypa hystricis UAMH7299]|uniref:Thioesterase domain-containing protein n=1 Tax=Polytolypa hystricis (strain UAMH7299) TaxID=1447883 RepID=A0A2B7XUN5_POLH7|nr:hypothetical protein AJ80_06817 [Polytolypa hystricis UAMH7299]
MASEEARKRATEDIEDFLEVYARIMEEKEFKGYDRQLMNDLRLIEGNPAGGATWELPVTEFWANLNGVMHGGAYGVIFDMCTAISMSTISREGYWEFLAGVTRSLNISYLKAIPVGTTIRIRATVIQHGKTMALIRGIMESPDGKKVYATAEHHKVALAELPEYSARIREKRVERRGIREARL